VGDDAVNREGVAIDDVHIFDNTLPIFTGPANSAAITQNVAGNDPVDFIEGGKIIATLFPNGNNLGSTETKAWFNVGAVRNDGNQYYANRNITIKPTLLNPPTPVTVRIYFTDAEVNELRTATGCANCTPTKNYTLLNMVKYKDAVVANEDGSLLNNIGGNWQTIPKDQILFVPYGIGYYADFSVSNFSEFWITDGNFNIPLPATWSAFDAVKQSNGDALLQWQTANEANLLQYEPEVAAQGANTFVPLAIVPAKNTNSAAYQYTDKRKNKTGTQLYRIKQTDRDGNISYSVTKSLRFGASGFTISTYPNPVTNMLLVKIDADNMQQFTWQITDAVGRISLQGKWNMNAGQAILSIPMRTLQTGLYNLGVFDGSQWRYQKIVKAQ
jgi:hypothetical protein